MAESGQEKSEAPTSRRRSEARNEGQVAKSQDLTAAVSLLFTMLLLYVFGYDTLMGMRHNLHLTLNGELVDNPTQVGDVGTLVSTMMRVTITTIGPLILCMALVALVATVGQVGFLVTTKPLEPNFGKLSPLKGAKNLVNARAAMRLAMSLLKVALIGGVAALVILDDMPRVVSMSRLELAPLFAAACELVFVLALKLAALLLVLALIDYVYQRWQHEQDLKMTKQEVREEMKRMDGDPLVKQRRQRVAKQLAMQRINQAVPGADVIVTNPTHFAVALRYDSDSMAAPRVVAKGADFMALRIRQIAMTHDVPIVERKELARALYRSVEVGQEVPAEHYAAVAEILAYVYRISGQRVA